MTEIPGEFPLPEEAAQRQRSLLGAHIEAGRRSSRTARRGVVAVAVVILVGGLLVTPALGIGSRLLDLIQSPPGLPEVKTPVWSPDGSRIAFFSRRDGNKDLYVVSADGSGERALGSADAWCASAWSPDGSRLVVASGRDGRSELLVVGRRRERNADVEARFGSASELVRTWMIRPGHPTDERSSSRPASDKARRSTLSTRTEADCAG